MAEKTLEEMRQAVAEIREKMAAAAREAGRDPAAVQLCAACKTRTAQTIAASAALPIDLFGENHVQELCANYDAGAYCGKPSHFIGHLQTNKIKKVLGRASLIQSVGSEHLLTAIEKEAAKAGIVQNVLLEVNIGGEESKSGVSGSGCSVCRTVHLCPHGGTDAGCGHYCTAANGRNSFLAGAAVRTGAARIICAGGSRTGQHTGSGGILSAAGRAGADREH